MHTIWSHTSPLCLPELPAAGWRTTLWREQLSPGVWGGSQNLEPEGWPMSLLHFSTTVAISFCLRDLSEAQFSRCDVSNGTLLVTIDEDPQPKLA